MRRDARERRHALIRAAADCFAEKGYSVPLEEICARAGVGRGTLYRNFQDRMALALAVFEQDIQELEAEIDMLLPIEDLLRAMLYRGAKASALFTRLATEMPLDQANLDGFHRLGQRVADMLQPLVDKAHADGALRPEVGTKELMIGMRMVSGLLLPKMPQKDVQTQIDVAMALLIRGLRAG